MFDFLKPSLPRCLFSGPTVSLRPPRWSDQKEWLVLRSESKAFLEPWEPAWSRDALSPAAFRNRVQRIRAEWRAGMGYGFFIVHNETGALLGGVTLANVRRGVVESANIGYWIGSGHARRGYMGEAIQIALDFAFTTLGLHRVEAACLVHNEASKSLLLKSGFQPEGRARKLLCIAGRWQDHDTFAILRTDDRPAVPVRTRMPAR
jgi:ribosomal-protein-alanine N-acetyltransferase